MRFRDENDRSQDAVLTAIIKTICNNLIKFGNASLVPLKMRFQI